MKYAGLGLKSVKKVFPKLNDRQASKLLHSLAGFIYTLPLGQHKIKRIKGDMGVTDTPYIHPASPRREDYEKEGVVGGVVMGMVKVDLDDLEDDLGFDLDLYSEDRMGLKELSVSLTKNITHNILNANTIFNLSDVYAPVHNLIEAPFGYEIKQSDLDEYSYKVVSLKFEGEVLHAKVRYQATYDIFAEKISSRRMRFLDL